MPLPHTEVCGQPPTLPKGWFLPLPSELNSPMLLPRREQRVKAPGKEGGEEGEESKSNDPGRVQLGESEGKELSPGQG